MYVHVIKASVANPAFFSSSISESNTITIWNNGKGIPVVEHKDEKMYVPALIFGHLLTSSNYDDDEKKVTGERSHVDIFISGYLSLCMFLTAICNANFVWPQVEGMVMVLSCATSSVPSSLWKLPARNTDTVSNRLG